MERCIKLETTKTLNVKIPKKWEKTKDGKYRAAIRYRESMGRIDPWSIPECVSLIQTFKTMFVMIADEHPVINDGDCLIFMQS